MYMRNECESRLNNVKRSKWGGYRHTSSNGQAYLYHSLAPGDKSLERTAFSQTPNILPQRTSHHDGSFRQSDAQPKVQKSASLATNLLPGRLAFSHSLHLLTRETGKGPFKIQPKSALDHKSRRCQTGIRDIATTRNLYQGEGVVAILRRSSPWEQPTRLPGATVAN
jgi:hypothetical protein